MGDHIAMDQGPALVCPLSTLMGRSCAVVPTCRTPTLHSPVCLTYKCKSQGIIEPGFELVFFGVQVPTFLPAKHGPLLQKVGLFWA